MVRRTRGCGSLWGALPVLIVLGASISALPATGQTERGSNQAAVIPGWLQLRAAYNYVDAGKPDVEERSKPDDTALMVHLSFNGPGGDGVAGLFARPKAAGVYPCVLLLHGLASDKETMVRDFGRLLLQHGVAILALDAPLHGERKADQPGDIQQHLLQVVQAGCLDYRTALDYLAMRKDVDSKHIVLLGYSLGSIMGAILGAVDNRIGAFALCAGSDPLLPLADKQPVAYRDQVYVNSPSLYIGHISPRPILMLNAVQEDTDASYAAALLYLAAGQPKQQLWYPTGHLLSQEAGKKAVEWLLAKVKPDRTKRTEK